MFDFVLALKQASGHTQSPDLQTTQELTRDSVAPLKLNPCHNWEPPSVIWWWESYGQLLTQIDDSHCIILRHRWVIKTPFQTWGFSSWNDWAPLLQNRSFVLVQHHNSNYWTWVFMFVSPDHILDKHTIWIPAYIYLYFHNPFLTTPQSPRQLRLQHLVTHNNGLVKWNRSRLTLLPSSGTAVLWGKTDESASPALHFYSCSSSASRKLKTLQKLCQHENDVFVLGLLRGKKEMLAVSCRLCKVIRLIDVESGEVSVAFHGGRHYPGAMCLGEAGEMFVVHSVKGVPILQLNCCTAEFSLIRSIKSGMERYHSICYIPIHRLIVITQVSPNKFIRAVSCESEKWVWEVKGQVDGVDCHPHGMVHSPALDALFVADSINTWILVLSPRDGSLRQVLSLDHKIGAVARLCLRNDQLVVSHGGFDCDEYQISLFSLE